MEHPDTLMMRIQMAAMNCWNAIDVDDDSIPEAERELLRAAEKAARWVGAHLDEHYVPNMHGLQWGE